MPTHEEWGTLIDRAVRITRHTARIRVDLPVDKLPSNAQPVKVVASDGNDYLVKGRQNRRVLVNDRIVGKLGRLLRAPVGDVSLIDVPAALIAAEPKMSHMEAGISHASRWIDDCTEQQGLQYATATENRARFAALTVLYSWAYASDQQFIYRKSAPNLVYSVDHGHFFPNGPDWTQATLQANLDPAIDGTFAPCSLRHDELEPYLITLTHIGAAKIAAAVASPPVDWAITREERIDLGIYLETRRVNLLGLFGP